MYLLKVVDCRKNKIHIERGKKKLEEIQIRITQQKMRWILVSHEIVFPCNPTPKSGGVLLLLGNVVAIIIILE